MKKGKLITVQIPGQPGRSVKMYEQDAVARGLIPGKQGRKVAGAQSRRDAGLQKSKPATRDKMRQPEGDKEAGTQAVDDFTVIDGVGLATDRALKARGLRTFEQLRTARDLSFLSMLAQNAIRRWREKSELSELDG